MCDQLKKLKDIVKSLPLIIGMGNELRGDDGAGLILVDHLQEGGYPAVINVNGNPENYLKKISEMPGNTRLWIDIINWGGQAGEFRIIEAEEIHHFAISTHNFSPAILLSYLKESRNIPDYFLGIQPYVVDLGSLLSPPVKKTIEFLITYILENCPDQTV